MVSRIDKIKGLFCRIASLLKVSFAKETYNLIDPTNCSHPILSCPARILSHGVYIVVCSSAWLRIVGSFKL